MLNNCGGGYLPFSQTRVLGFRESGFYSRTMAKLSTESRSLDLPYVLEALWTLPCAEVFSTYGPVAPSFIKPKGKIIAFTLTINKSKFRGLKPHAQSHKTRWQSWNLNQACLIPSIFFPLPHS